LPISPLRQTQATSTRSLDVTRLSRWAAPAALLFALGATGCSAPADTATADSPAAETPARDTFEYPYPALAERIVTALQPTSGERVLLDRKSTRLNSSHVKISYAVFCLKKKTAKNTT